MDIVPMIRNANLHMDSKNSEKIIKSTRNIKQNNVVVLKTNISASTANVAISSTSKEKNTDKVIFMNKLN